MLNSDKKFTWTKQKLDIAKALSEGTQTHQEIAKVFNITNVTISRWKSNPEFMQKVDEYTLAHDLGTKAGLLRGLYYGLQKKSPGIKGDRTSYLDFSKEIAELQGLKKQQIEHSGSVGISKIEILHAKRDDPEDDT